MWILVLITNQAVFPTFLFKLSVVSVANIFIFQEFLRKSLLAPVSPRLSHSFFSPGFFIFLEETLLGRNTSPGRSAPLQCWLRPAEGAPTALFPGCAPLGADTPTACREMEPTPVRAQL